LIILEEFIPDLISNIFLNPSGFKCSLDAINFAIFLKSEKSLALDPLRGFLSKRGIIFSFISDKLVTIKLTANPLLQGSTLPQLKIEMKLFINKASRLC
jgi:hypothetical protein